MAEYRVLSEAQIVRDDGEIVYDGKQRKQAIVRIVLDFDGTEAVIFQPVPEIAAGWIGPVLATTAQHAADEAVRIVRS